MSIDFEALLSKQIGTETGPKPLPTGTYIGQIAQLPESRTRNTKEGEKPTIDVKISLTEASVDVDSDELAAVGGLLKANGEPKQLTYTFWLTESAMFMLDNFLASFGFSGSYAEGLEQLPGQSVMVYVTRESYEKNGQTRTVNRLENIAANA